MRTGRGRPRRPPFPPTPASGFAPSFRFGNPFFLAPNVDELVKRFQVKDNFSIVTGKHTIKTGGEWLHTNNVQVFRGFFEGRYLFDSVTGFLRYASPAAPGGFGPFTVGLLRTAPTSPRRRRARPARRPPAVRCCSTCRAAARTASRATPPAPPTSTTNELALFVQDSWQAGHGLTLDYGLRWDAQLMPETVDPKTTAFAAFLSDPRFPSDGTIPSQWKQFQPRVGVRLGRQPERQDGRPRQRRGLLRAAEHAQPGGLGHDQRHPAEERLPRSTAFVATCRCGRTCCRRAPCRAGTFPLFTGIRVFDRNYQNPRIYSFNAGFEREVAPNVAAYVDFTYAKGVHLTRFLNYNVHGTGGRGRPSRRRATRRPTSAPIRSSRSSATCSSPTASATACIAALTLRRAQALLAAIPARSELRPVEG